MRASHSLALAAALLFLSHFPRSSICNTLCWQVWLKPVAEMSFLYGNNVLKSGLGRMTEHTPAHTGVVVYSMSDVPLGFGVAAKSTADCRRADPSTVVVFHQSDVGEQAFPRCAWLKVGLAGNASHASYASRR